VPVAEPSGEYDLLCSVDLSPLYGKIEEKKSVAITQPPADILDRRLAELESEDVGVRSTAASDLAYFEGEGERVFPALLTCLDDPEEDVAQSALYSLYYYPVQIKAHTEYFLKLLCDMEKPQRFQERAAYYLGRYGDASAKVEKALEEAVKANENPSSSRRLEYALNNCRQRMKTESED
jgi:HEAT repeat protein